MADSTITMKRYNGSSYDTLYPATTIAQVDGGQKQLRVVALSLPVSWTEADGYYTQTVTISGGTANTKVDLSADYVTILQMVDDGTTALYVENNNGVFTCYAVGEAPTVALSVYATISDVTPPPLINTTWLFNDAPSLTNMPYPVSVAFECDGNPWTGMTRTGSGSNLYLQYIMSSGPVNAYSMGSNSWSTDAFRTIKLTEEPTDTAFVAWLQANATQQS